MQTLIAIKDPHFRFGALSRIRKDSFSRVIDKLQFVADLCKQYNAEHILIPGDVFDISYSDQWSIHQLMYTKQILENTFFKNNIKILAIPGNHDYLDGYFGYERPSKKYPGVNIRTPYGELVHSYPTQFIDLSESGISISEDIEVFGIPYDTNYDKILHSLEIINQESANQISICLLHQNVTPNSVTNITEFTYDQLAEFTNIDVYVLGHYHVGYPIQKVKNSLFINPYNLTRVVRDYETKMDMHIPQAAIIHIDGKEVTAEYVEIPHEPYESIFVTTYEDLLKTVDSDLDSYELTISDDFIVHDNLEILRNATSDDEEVQAYVFSKLEGS